MRTRAAHAMPSLGPTQGQRAYGAYKVAQVDERGVTADSCFSEAAAVDAWARKAQHAHGTREKSHSLGESDCNRVRWR